MRSFFRRLLTDDVAFILISGQAAVLYGAATFSEDVDLWVAPERENWARLVKSLRATRARVYKLTPPLEPGFVRRGHGFHFVLPADDAGPRYLDVMGRPPRVGRFRAALRRACVMATGWGRIPVVSVPDLVQLKKTRRLGDYDVISRLVRIETSRRERPTARHLSWALANTFGLADAAWLLDQHPRASALARAGARRSLRELVAARTLSRGEPELDAAARIQTLLNEEIAVLQHADVVYWAPVIDELRLLRRGGRLLPDGSAM